jgi:hypothetical protein
VFGALTATVLGGFRTVAIARPIDLIGGLVANAIAVLLVIRPAQHLAERWRCTTSAQTR